jgi:hypothetical protein
MSEYQVPEGWPEGLDPRATLAVVQAPQGDEGHGPYPIEDGPGGYEPGPPHNTGIVPPHLNGLPSPFDVFQHALDHWLEVLGHPHGPDYGPTIDPI